MKIKRIIPLVASMLLLSSCSFLRFSSTSSTLLSSSSSTSTSGSTTVNHSSTNGSTGVSGTTSGSVSVHDKAEWTILIYMCGSNLESGYNAETFSYEDDYYLATSDIAEILSVSGQPDDVNIVIETGGAKRWKTTSAGGYGISNSKLGRYHVQNQQLVLDQQLTNASMGKQSTLESFLNYGLTYFPANKTGVIFWDHGGGMFGVCNDENNDDDCLLNSEVNSAFESVFTSKGISKLEFVGYDACLMSIQDVAEFNSSYFNYMVSSQESENGYGWAYSSWVDDLYAKKTTPVILKAIVDGFIASMGGVDAVGESYMGEYYPADQTLSYLDLSYMNEYKTAWENLATQLSTKVSSTTRSTFRKNVIGKTKYFASTDYDYFSEYDVSHFLTILGNNSTFNPGSTYINAVSTALNKLVAYNVAQTDGAKDAHGLSFFFPSGSSEYLSYQKEVYTTNETNFSNWRTFVTSAGGSVSSTYSTSSY